MSIKKILLVAVLMLITGASLFSVQWRSDSEIERITVSGNYTIERNEILQIARLKDTLMNAEEIDLMNIQDRIGRHPEIKKVFVSINKPSELVIEIIERRPVAVLNSEDGLKLLDEELEAFEFKSSEKMYDLPVVSGVRHELKPGSKIKFNKDDLRLALFIILNTYKYSRTAYNNISEVNMSDTGKVIIYLAEDSCPIYFPRSTAENITNPGCRETILNRIKVFDSYLKQNLDNHLKGSIKYVDLRYNNRVIVNSKKENGGEEEKITG